ncbi:MAG: hypothetical protein HZB41_09500 [Ignavibacteriae bacterium]|nr:hypothetical protein [Ignavibacteriota bacterium]
MTLFVKYIAAILSSFSMLFSTTGVSLLHHLCMHSGNHEVTLNYESPNEDECADGSSCCAMDDARDLSKPAFTLIDCCKDYTDYAVISIAYISQHIENFSSNIYSTEEFIGNNVQKLIENSENNILVKPPGFLKLPVKNIISYILHSTDISSELPA